MTSMKTNKYGYALSALLMVLLLVSVICMTTEKSFAEKKSKVITDHGVKGKLAVSFQFDVEEVPITLISPGGQKFSEGSKGVAVYRGEKWVLFEIEDAEKGEWKAEYDLGVNSVITYHILESEGGIAIQNFAVGKVNGSKAKVSFEVDRPVEAIRYSWVITASDESVTDEEGVRVGSGSAKSGEKVEDEIDLSDLSSSDGVVLSLYVEGTSPNGNEEFDTLLCDPFAYTNPDSPEAMKSYRVLIDHNNHYLEIDWEGLDDGSEHRIRVTADDNTDNYLMKEDLESDVTNTGLYYPADTKKLTVSLSYLYRGLYSKEKVVEIDLENGDYLLLEGENVTAGGNVILSYRSSKPAILSVFTGERQEPAERKDFETREEYEEALRKEGAEQYRIQEEGKISLPMQQSETVFYAEFEGEENVFHFVDTRLQYSAFPPEIVLYEDPDGMTYKEGEIEITGLISHGTSLTIDGAEVELGEDGSFSKKLTLKDGENVFELTASNELGVTATKVLTVYQGTGNRSRAAAGQEPLSINRVIKEELSQRGLSPWLPLLAALALSLILIIVFWLVLRKERSKGIILMLLMVMVDVIAAFLAAGSMLLSHVIAKDMGDTEILSMMERSFEETWKYMQLKDSLFNAGLVFTGVFVVGLVLTILLGIRLRKKNKV